ncbi:MAG: glucosyltransferase domain-containing protein [Acetobacter sp.]|nr:glucosyltransferase domain-containing protein [Acetobacter sp.]
MGYMETETKIIAKLKAVPAAYKKSFWLAFALINLAFLFHTINFMFGDHDWNYVRTANYWSEGTFEGRPLHFVLQSIFFGGEVLPVLNNLFSFAAMTLSGILLAKYWQIPFSTLNYTLFTVFIAILPYTMVWLFYAKDTLINLSLPLICVSGLLVADYAVKTSKPLYHLIAIMLFYFAYASYAAVINLLGVCFIGNIILNYGYNKENVIALSKEKIIPAIDIIIALVLFKLTLVMLSIDSGYNTQTITLEYLPEKLQETITVMFTQFITPLPFMEYKFKLMLLVLSVLGFILLLLKGGVGRIVPLIVLVLGVLFSSKIAFFLADERGQILAEMENFAFVPRLDFYGLVYLYALGLACILKTQQVKIRKIGIGIAIIIAAMSLVRDMYAQKVWKFGFDAEMKAHERIVTRLEQRADFDAARHYRILQIGSLSLRKNFYLQQPYEEISLDLLSTSFTPQFMSRIVYNFYYPQEIFYDNAIVEQLSAQGKNWLQTKARPFPHKDSIYIDGDIIIIVLNKEGLNKALR